jgi:hypothetical protein
MSHCPGCTLRDMFDARKMSGFSTEARVVDQHGALGILARQTRRLALFESAIPGFIMIVGSEVDIPMRNRLISSSEKSEITRRVYEYYRFLVEGARRKLHPSPRLDLSLCAQISKALGRLLDACPPEDKFYLCRKGKEALKTIFNDDPEDAAFIGAILQFAPLGIVAQPPQGVGIWLYDYNGMPPPPVCAPTRLALLSSYRQMLSAESMRYFGFSTRRFVRSPPDEVAIGRHIASAFLAPATFLVSGYQAIASYDTRHILGWLQAVYLQFPFHFQPDKYFLSPSTALFRYEQGPLRKKTPDQALAASYECYTDQAGKQSHS